MTQETDSEFVLRQLRLSDVPFVSALEESSFPAEAAATPEKISYRIRTCPEMTLGMFEVTEDGDEGSLLAMIHGTRTSSGHADDKSMKIGSHEPFGPTVALHTLCVHPAWRAKGLGKRIMNEYTDRMKHTRGVERIALIAEQHIVPFYERLGFVNEGEAETKHGGMTWYDCIYTISK